VSNRGLSSERQGFAAAGHGLEAGLDTAGISAPSVSLVPGDDVSVGCDELVDGDDVLGDDDVLDLVLALGEDEVVDVRAGAAVVLAQVLEAVAPALALDAAVPLGLALDVGFGEVVGLGLTLGLGLELALALLLVVPLELALALLLALPVLALAEAAVLLVAVAVAALACAAALDELAVDDAHDATAAGLLAPLGAWLADAPLGDPAPEPPVLAGWDAELCGPASPTAWRVCWRSGGTAASTMPTANTAKPTANAGRSMASRQSRGRCACRGRSGLARWAPGAVCPWRTTCQPRTRASYQRRTRSATKLSPVPTAAKPNHPALA
jgi:hypothetical protein